MKSLFYVLLALWIASVLAVSESAVLNLWMPYEVPTIKGTYFGDFQKPRFSEISKFPRENPDKSGWFAAGEPVGTSYLKRSDAPFGHFLRRLPLVSAI